MNLGLKLVSGHYSIVGYLKFWILGSLSPYEYVFECCISYPFCFLRWEPNLSFKKGINGHYMKCIFQNSNLGHINLNICAFKCYITFWNQLPLSHWIFVLLWWQKWTDLSSINLKKVICSTWFYSPAGIENNPYKICQLSMWCSAAESRRFGRK